MSVLFLAHRIPFPPDRGDKIRSHHLVRAMARISPVHIACFADNASEMAYEGDIASLSQSYCLVRRHKSIGWAGGEGLLLRKSISLTAFYDAEISNYVKTVLKEFRIETIFVFSGQMAQYVPSDFAGRVVVDFVDMDSEKFADYAASSSGFMKYIYGREAKKLRDFEIMTARRADLSTFVSKNEVDVFLSYAPDLADHVRTLSNGIDTSGYDPRSVSIVPLDGDNRDSDIVFTGQMDYPPNVEAVIHFAKQLLPQIRLKHPHARFVIVGRQPTTAVQALHNDDDVIVTGEVKDVRPWLLAARMVVAPLSVARGVQNKVLEAMAMEKPVFVSQEAATGIEAEHGKHFMISSNDDEMVEQINTMFESRKKLRAMGIVARRHVQDTMSWSAMLAEFPEIILGSEAQLREAE